MKFLIILLFPLLTQGQKKWYKPFVNSNDIIIYSAQFIAGAADGMHEVLINHIHTFERIWPNANMKWWNPDSSQNNKHHFPTIISDAYHVTRTIEHTMNYFSIAISFTDVKQYSRKQLLLLIAKRMVMSMMVNRTSFKLVYNIAFNDKQERPH